MAAEAQVQEISPPPPHAVAAPPAATPEKRGAPTDGEEQEEERPEPKRRRAHVAALENVPRAAAVAATSATASEGSDSGEPAGGCEGGSSFSFHARSFSGVETTPKFGSFNPDSSAEFAAFRLTRPLEPAEVDSPAAGVSDDEEQVDKGRDGNSHQCVK